MQLAMVNKRINPLPLGLHIILRAWRCFKSYWRETLSTPVAVGRHWHAVWCFKSWYVTINTQQRNT